MYKYFHLSHTHTRTQSKYAHRGNMRGHWTTKMPNRDRKNEIHQTGTEFVRMLDYDNPDEGAHPPPA